MRFASAAPGSVCANSGLDLDRRGPGSASAMLVMGTGLVPMDCRNDARPDGHLRRTGQLQVQRLGRGNTAVFPLWMLWQV